MYVLTLLIAALTAFYIHNSLRKSTDPTAQLAAIYLYFGLAVLTVTVLTSIWVIEHHGQVQPISRPFHWAPDNLDRQYRADPLLGSIRSDLQVQ